MIFLGKTLKSCYSSLVSYAALITVLFVTLLPLSSNAVEKRKFDSLIVADYWNASDLEKEVALNHGGLWFVTNYKEAKKKLRNLYSNGANAERLIERDHLVPTAAYPSGQSHNWGVGAYNEGIALTINIPFEMHRNLLSTGTWTASPNSTQANRLGSVVGWAGVSSDFSNVTSASQYRTQLGNYLDNTDPMERCKAIKVAVADYIYALKNDGSWPNLATINADFDPDKTDMRSEAKEAVEYYIEHTKIQLGDKRNDCKTSITTMWDAEF